MSNSASGRSLCVLVISPAYPPMVGGGEAYAARYAQEVANRGHAITVITSDAREPSHLWRGAGLAGSAPKPPQGSSVVRQPLLPMPFGHVGVKAWRALMVRISCLRGDHRALLSRMSRLVPRMDLRSLLAAAEPVDIIHAYNISWEGPLIAAADEANRRGVPLVLTPFMHFGIDQARKPDRVARNNAMQHQVSALISADAVIALTQVEAEGLARLGVSPARIHVLPAGIDPLSSSISPPDPPDATPSACFVGRNSRDKGVFDMIEAIAILAQRGVDLRLEIAGPTERPCQALVSRLPEPVRQRIRIHGLITEEAKRDMLARSRFLLLPSRVDSFGMVIQEAWRQGLPVIGARAGGIQGLVRDGVDGLLVEFGDAQGLADAMAALLADPTRSYAMGAAGQSRLPQEFSWPRLADRLTSIYRAVLT